MKNKGLKGKTFKTTPVGGMDPETNSMTWKVNYLADLETIIKNLRSLKLSFEDLIKQDRYSEDREIRKYYYEIDSTYRSLRKYLKNTYPEEFNKIMKTLYIKEISENILKEISTSGMVGSYNSKQAFKSPTSGYKTVNSKNLRRKVKGIVVRDLWK